MGFIHIGIIDIIDIFLVAMMLYYLYRVTRGTNAFSIILGVVMLYLMYVVVRALNMELLSGILGQFIGVGIIAVVVIFQPEIRRFLQMLGLQQNQRISRFFGGENNEDDLDVDSLVKACIDMGETKTGALIVLQQTSDLSLMAEGGIAVDAKVSPSLLENLFFKNSPLHDGAMVISGNRITAARCTLPITERTDIPANYGTRHKAAIGITEETDADVIVVSEETGRISFVRGGNVTPINNINELKLLLNTSVEEE